MRRIVPLLVLAAGLLGGAALGLHLASWDALAARQAALRGVVAESPGLAAAGYLALYAAAVALSFPGAALLTVLGGWLFGGVLGAALAVGGGTLGAAGFFLVARAALRPAIARIAARRPGVASMQTRMRRDGFATILALRLLPVVPFWLINIAAAMAGVRFRSFALATLLGVMPAGAIYAALGAGVGGVLAAGGQPDLGVMLSPPVLLPLVGLAALAVLPALKRRK